MTPLQEIFIGFRTPSGQIKTTQTFKTIELPRLVRGKPGAWDPLVCLDWGHQFLTFLKGAISEPEQDARKVWRVRFVPGVGINMSVLDDAGVKDVEAGEDRVGLLPRWYWDEARKKETDGAAGHPSSSVAPSSAPKVAGGWKI